MTVSVVTDALAAVTCTVVVAVFWYEACSTATASPTASTLHTPVTTGSLPATRRKRAPGFRPGCRASSAMVVIDAAGSV